ncbi:MAG: hypothetical protein ABMA64_26025 [Myxococcota bacterium]
MLDAVLSLVAELVFTLVGEVLVELGLTAVTAPFDGRGPWVELVGYGLLGAVVGGASLLVRPAAAIHDPTLALVSLALAPVVGGGLMAALGAARARRGKRVIRLDTFGCGATFALAFAGVRWALAA